MNNIKFQYVMLRELEDLDKVRLIILDHLLALKKKVDRVYNKHAQ